MAILLKKMTIFVNFVEKNVKFLTFNWQFSGGSDTDTDRSYSKTGIAKVGNNEVILECTRHDELTLLPFCNHINAQGDPTGFVFRCF